MQADEITGKQQFLLYNFSLIKYNAEVISPAMPGRRKELLL
jgi:hypothetical protein